MRKTKHDLNWMLVETGDGTNRGERLIKPTDAAPMFRRDGFEKIETS